MKTTDPRDPLDQQIDRLLKTRPLEPSKDFTSRVLQACETEPKPRTASAECREPGKLLRFALPLAAAIAIGLAIAPRLKETVQPDTTPPQLATNTTERQAPAIESASGSTALALLGELEAQEIFLIEETLDNFALTEENAELGSGKLLATFDALLYEIQS